MTNRLAIAVLILIAGIFAILALAMMLIPHFYAPPTEAGEFGDMFGGVNALFSGLAFIGVIFAILLQRQELQLQREEIEQTRLELKGQRIQLEAQNRTFRQQTFDNAFFQLLRLQSKIVNSIDIRGGSANADATTLGRDCFVQFYGFFREQFIHAENQSPEEDLPTLVSGAYMKFYPAYQSDVGHYFRSLYNIVKFIDRSDTTDPRIYTNLVRAQLSSHELLRLQGQPQRRIVARAHTRPGGECN